MKNTFLIIALVVSLVSCEKKATPTKEFKTAYVDTSKLIQEANEAKDIKAKYEAKAEEMGAKLKAETQKFQSEASNFKANVQKNGPEWAQQKGAELQKTEQRLQYAQDAMMRQLQNESGTEMDSLVSKIKKSLKVYGKEKGYDYIYGTGDATSVLYAKDSYDLTKELIQLTNSNYKKPSSK